MGLAIVNEKTLSQVSVKQMVIRYFMYIVSSFVLCLGLVSVGFSKKKKGWHDMAAGTLVVKRATLNKLKDESGLTKKKIIVKAPIKTAA